MSTEKESFPIYASIGALIIDDIIYQDCRQVSDILGGGGVFAIYGMRLWERKQDSKNVGYIIHKGFDYPKAIDDQIQSLDISLVTQYHADKHTTRGLNTFGADDHRDFEYKHPIIRTTTSNFPDSWIQSVKILHLISSPVRANEIIDEWKARELLLGSIEPTQFLWEPLPWACLPENLGMIYEASMKTEIITPNHEEIADMLGLDFKKVLANHNDDFKASVEYCAIKFLDDMPNKASSKIKTLVVRASKYGTMVVDLEKKISWIAAYWSWWSKQDQEHVVDVTGAGNAFCGGYAYGWVHSNGNSLESAYYGAVAASYTVEQIGVPIYDGNNDQWNDSSPLERLDVLKKKECKFY